MDDLDTTLAGLRADLPDPSPLALSRARVKLVNHATGERPARVRLFSRPSMRIAVIGVIAAAAVAGVGFYGSLGPSGSGEAVPVPPKSGARHTTGTPRASVHVNEAGWSVDTLTGGDVKLTMKWLDSKTLKLNANAFEKTLARAGVPAITRPGEVCDPNELPLQHQAITFRPMTTWTVHPAKMPVGSRIVIDYQALPMGGLDWGVSLEVAGHPLHCAPAPDPHWTPQPGWTAPTDDPAHNSKTADGPAKNT